MAVMTDEQRVQAWLKLLPSMIEEVDLTDPDVRAAVLAAVNAVDDWTNANQASFVAALPEPFRTWSTPRQKVAVLVYVVLERFNVGTE